MVQRCCNGFELAGKNSITPQYAADHHAFHHTFLDCHHTSHHRRGVYEPLENKFLHINGPLIEIHEIPSTSTMSEKPSADAIALGDSEKSIAPLRYSPDVTSEQFKQEVESNRSSLRGRNLTWAIAFVTGTGFTLFGYV